MSWLRPSVAGPAPSARCAHATEACGNGKLYVFGGWNGSKMLNDLLIFHLDSMSWTKPVISGAVPGVRAGHTMTAVKTKLFIFGGGDGSHYLNDLHILDTETMAWSQAYVAGTSPAARSRHTATLVGKRLFVFGGGDDTRVYNDLYVLDTDTMAWSRPETKGTAPVARWGHIMTLIDENRLLIFGGHDGSVMLNDLHILDTNSLSWVQITGKAADNNATANNATNTGSSSNSGGGSLNSSGNILRDSGNHSINATATSNSNNSTSNTQNNNSNNNNNQPTTTPTSTTTSPNAPPNTVGSPSARAGHTATMIGKKVLIFGGGDGTKILNDSWFLDTTADFQWCKPTISGNAPSGRCAHTANVLDSKLIIYGGGDGGRRFKDLYSLDIDEMLRLEEVKRIRRKSLRKTKSELKERDDAIRSLDICTWLTELGMKQYVDKFIAEEISFDVLPCLTEQHLVQLGVTTMGARFRILTAIKSLQTSRENDNAKQQRSRQEVAELTSSVKQLNESIKTAAAELFRALANDHRATSLAPPQSPSTVVAVPNKGRQSLLNSTEVLNSH